MLKCIYKFINNIIIVIKLFEVIIDLFKRYIKFIKIESVMFYVLFL